MQDKFHQVSMFKVGTRLLGWLLLLQMAEQRIEEMGIAPLAVCRISSTSGMSICKVRCE